MSVARVKPEISRIVGVEVWFCSVDDLNSVDHEQVRSLLSSDEQARNRRFLVDHPRHLHAAAYALARHAIGRRLGLPPAELRFGRAPGGRPFLAHPRGMLDFNLAHGGGLAVCALADGCRVGIDVEPADRPELSLELLDGLLAPGERDRVTARQGSARQEALVGLWVGKEAVAKAHGGGLSLPLDRLVVPEGDGPVTMTAVAGALPPVWRLHRLRPDRRHRMALALALAPDAPAAISFHDATQVFRGHRPPAASAGPA
ncbi:MAG TPA: 4'-phosphopantetheinyl transferase superfamily protein [Geminicoccus sp.]|uniref:4'-phosphopantetheinyl transferase family protein n=1 Tax=Geminicoccus sp. TaxID=2024832 RepID=UPI002C83287B|nr:4'-phosphopantetheinyl transferase superfamily protein [Geminicoccus sp.]HWL68778.1 4'-phosphopantetheinyl transferase superfamily protein [Geminicoccus sp.]